MLPGMKMLLCVYKNSFCIRRKKKETRQYYKEKRKKDALETTTEYKNIRICIIKLFTLLYNKIIISYLDNIIHIYTEFLPTQYIFLSHYRCVEHYIKTLF